MLHKQHILRGISSHQTIFYLKFLIVLKNNSNPHHSGLFQTWVNHSPEQDLPENGHIETFFIQILIKILKKLPATLVTDSLFFRTLGQLA